MRETNQERPKPKLEEARRRWGTAAVLSGNPTHNPQPAPEAPAAAEQVRRAA
jgi:hypothetical protein